MVERLPSETSPEGAWSPCTWPDCAANLQQSLQQVSQVEQRVFKKCVSAHQGPVSEEKRLILPPLSLAKQMEMSKDDRGQTEGFLSFPPCSETNTSDCHGLQKQPQDNQMKQI